MLTRLPLALGLLEGYRLAIDVPALTTALGALIRDDSLDVSRPKPASDKSMRRVA
jgi:hypothetical protein